MIRLPSVLALGCSLVAVSAPPERSPVQVMIGVTVASAQEIPFDGQPSASEIQLESGLPQRVPPPRTIQGHWPVYVAFALSWIGIVGYTLTLGASFGKISREPSSSLTGSGWSLKGTDRASQKCRLPEQDANAAQVNKAA